MEATAVPLQSPLPRFFRHPLRWLVNRVQTLGTSAIFAHIGILAVVAAYYLIFEVWHPMTTAWHWVINDSYWRHLVRSVGEYFLGTLLVQQIIWNPFKHKLSEPHWFDRAEMKLHITNLHQKARVTTGQLLAAPVVAVVYAIPGFFIGAGVIWLLHKGFHTGRLAPVLTAHPNFAAKLYADSIDQHVVGIIAGFCMGRRPMRKVFNDVQYFFAERRVSKGKQAHFWHPPAFRALTCEIALEHGQESAQARIAEQSNWVPVLMVGGLFLLIALAGFGYHVLHDIATT